MLEAGLTAQVEIVVADSDTALAFGSGDVPVLAAPRALALCEEATVAAVAPELEPGRTSVGVRVEFDHIKASAVGTAVTARATLTEVDGSRLSFDVDVSDGDGWVGRGKVVRVVVDRARFGG